MNNHFTSASSPPGGRGNGELAGVWPDGGPGGVAVPAAWDGAPCYQNNEGGITKGTGKRISFLFYWRKCDFLYVDKVI